MVSSRLSTCLEAVISAECSAQLSDAVFLIKDLYQLSHVAFHMTRSDERSSENPVLILTYPLEWIELYQRMNFFRIDPVVRLRSSGFLPVDWSVLVWDGPEVKAFVREAETYGVGRRGLTIPVRSPGGETSLLSATANVSEDTWSDQRTRTLPDLHFLAHYLHEQSRKVTGAHSGGGGQLSVREQQCVKLVASGLIAKQIASHLQISESAVRQYFASARRKLEVDTLPQAIARATRLGIIDQ